MRLECLCELFERANRTCIQTVEPPHRHRLQAGWKYLAHQGLIFEMDSHSLVEVTYVLQRVCTFVMHGECGLSEPLRKSPFPQFCV